MPTSALFVLSSPRPTGLSAAFQPSLTSHKSSLTSKTSMTVSAAGPTPHHRTPASDPARSLPALLYTYAAPLAALRAAASPPAAAHALPDYFDDVYLLRYLISARSRLGAATKPSDPRVVTSAAELVAKSVAVRAGCADWLKSARDAAKAGGYGRDLAGPPGFVALTKVFVSGFHPGGRTGTAVVIVRLGHCVFKELGAKVGSAEEVKRVFLWATEALYALIDHQTRTTNVLTKAVYVLDMADLALFGRRGFLNPFFHRVQAEASKMNEFMYPQLIESMVVVNAPRFAKRVSGFIEKVNPRYSQKLRICAGDFEKKSRRTKAGGSVGTAAVAEGGGVPPSGNTGTLGYMDSVMDREMLPTFLGGSCTCKEKGGCVGGVPNDGKVKD